MVELPGESVLFLRVTPGNVEKAIRELKKRPEVKEAEPILGPYDVAITGAFKDFESLRKFQEEVEGKEYCEGCVVNPSFEQWTREEAEEKPLHAWTLIRAANAPRAMKELQKIPSVNRLYSTTGEYNLIADIAVDELSKLQETVMKDIHKISGIRRTQTLASVREVKK